jgi:lipopolysaccharide export system permease protein
MIIFRYLVREVFSTLFATTVILLLIFLSTQFVHYLSAAALGKYTGKILLTIMLLQTPYLLGLLFPVGLFLALLLAYGRLYADREMIVLTSCGFGQARLIIATLIMAVSVSIVVAVLNLWLAPIVATKQKVIMAEAKAAPLIDFILPGRFFSTDNGKKVFYVKQISRNRESMQNIFIAEKDISKQTSPNNPNGWMVVVADQGYQNTAKTGDHFIVINQGRRYTGVPGESNFQIDRFGQYFLRLESKIPTISHDEQTLSTPMLWNQLPYSASVAAEFQWRLSLPISVILLALLAVPLCRFSPRQGRYASLLPAMLIYISYANLMFLARSWIEMKIIPVWLGVWWLHGLLLLLIVVLLAWQGRWLQLLKYRYLGSADNSAGATPSIVEMSIDPSVPSQV